MTSHNHRTRILFLCRDLASRESSQTHAMWSSCKSIPGDGERYTSLATCNGHCLAAMVLEGLKGLRGILSIWNVEGVYPKYCQMILVKNPNFKTRDVTAKTLKFDLDIDSQKLQCQKEVYNYELRHIVFQHVSTNIFQGQAAIFLAASLTRKGPWNRLVFHFAGFVSAPNFIVFQTSHVQSTQGEVTSCKMDVGDIFREAGSEVGGVSLFVGPRLLRMDQPCSESLELLFRLRTRISRSLNVLMR